MYSLGANTSFHIFKWLGEKKEEYFMTCENYMTEFSMSTDEVLLENSHTFVYL